VLSVATQTTPLFAVTSLLVVKGDFMDKALVTCVSCGWVHTLVPVEEALSSVESFNAYFWDLPFRKRCDLYGNKAANIATYLKCFKCGSCKPMRWFIEGDCPKGVTVQPTILYPFLGTY